MQWADLPVQLPTLNAVARKSKSKDTTTRMYGQRSFPSATINLGFL